MSNPKFKIYRYDPSVDAAPYYTECEVPWQDDGETDFMSVLQCLTWIYENVDQIAYDSNCGAGWCGRCGMMINGRPRLACFTKVVKGETYLLEPLKGFPVIRDLVVDKDATYQKYVETDVAVQSSKPMTELVDIDYDFFYNTLHKFNRCRECMCCYAACPKTNHGLTDLFIGPGAMMQIAMRHNDPNDEADRVWQAAFSGVFECDLCGECSTACMAAIDIVGMMNSLQKAARAKGLEGCEPHIPAAQIAIAEAIAAAKAAQEEGNAGSSDFSGMTAQEIVEASCATGGCHSSEEILGFKTDAESAKLRVDSHLKATAPTELTDEQKQQFIDMFTE